MTLVHVPNPILPGCHPDPSICRVGDAYYLAVSTFELMPAVPILRSVDLASWETVGHVVDRDGVLDLDGIRSSGGIYAPTLRHDGTRFWLVTTVVDPDRLGRGGTFIASALDAAGPWSDLTWIDVEGIDPSLLFDDDGRVWMHGTRLVAEPEWHHQTEVWVRELRPDAGELVGEEHVVWTGAVRGAVWAEGPHLLRTDDGYLLVAAEGGTAFEHAVCVARAERPTGPFVGAPTNPVLTHRHLGASAPVQAVGHADLVETPDGAWWAVLLATRPGPDGRHPLGRETFLCPVAWERGWPVFAPGEGRVPASVPLRVAAPAPAASWQPDSRTAGVVLPGDPRWTSVRAMPTRFATPEPDGWLLRATDDALADAGTPAFLGVRQQHLEVDVAVDVDALDDEACAALVVRQSEADHVALAVRRDASGRTATLVHRRDGVAHELGAVQVAAHGPVALALAAREGRMALSVDGVALGDVDAGLLDTASNGGFLGVWIGIASIGAPGTAVRCTGFAYRPVC